jgi:5-enolpyruvylshikimate-3-phosphate synthase
MCPILLSEPKQLGDECSRPFGPFGLPQLNVEVKHGSEIVVERESASWKQSISVPVLSSSQLFFAAAGLISFEILRSQSPAILMGEGAVA